LYRASLLDPLGPATRADAQNVKELSHIPMLRATILHLGKNFQMESIIGVIEDDILLDNRSRWIHEVTCEIKMTCLEVNQRQAGYWIDLVNTKALLEWNGYRKALVNPQRCCSMIDVSQGVHLVGSE
jgi:hypothetical protein